MTTRVRRDRVAGRMRPAIAVTACLALSACFGGAEATRSSSDPARLAEAPHLDSKGAVVSPLIEELRLRESVLPAGSSYAKVADAVLASSAASAEAQLRVKRLTARARSKNWLPKLGPDVNLTSLGSIAANLLLDQALFDNGKRKAERDFAAADVEVAAITLATDLNARVHEGLALHIEAQRARELASITETALKRMGDFDRIMALRVEGGLSDGSEYRVVSQKRAEMEATLSTERQGAERAEAELASLADRPMTDVKGLSPLPADAGRPDPLAVLLARGEAARVGAEVRMARAGFMAGIGAGATLDKGGDLSADLSLDGDILGFGRKDALQALAESEEVTNRKVDEAKRSSDRRIVALTQEIQALMARDAREGKVLKEMEANLSLFTEQYKAGRRSLIELVGQFESMVSMKRDHASIKYQIAAARLDIARERGVLVDGARM